MKVPHPFSFYIKCGQLQFYPFLFCFTSQFCFSSGCLHSAPPRPPPSPTSAVCPDTFCGFREPLEGHSCCRKLLYAGLSVPLVPSCGSRRSLHTTGPFHGGLTLGEQAPARELNNSEHCLESVKILPPNSKDITREHLGCPNKCEGSSDLLLFLRFLRFYSVRGFPRSIKRT